MCREHPDATGPRLRQKVFRLGPGFEVVFAGTYTTTEGRFVMSEPQHQASPEEPDSSHGLVGFAAIKYTAIVVIVLAILAFIAWYLIPLFTD